MQKKPLVSIIIPTLNSERFLSQTLQSVKDQTYPEIEVLVMVGGSTDKTEAIAKKFGARIYKKGLERAEKINYGMTKAKGKYGYRIDDDFVLEPEVVEQCVQKCEKEDFDGIAVHNTSAEGLGFWADVRKLERNCYRDDDLIVGVRFFSKKAFEKIGGFDPTLFGPEDYDFHNRFVEAGFKFGRIKAIERHLGEPKSLWIIIKKSYLYGREMAHYYKKHPPRARRQLNPARKAFLRHWQELAKHPVLSFGLVVMWAGKFAAGGLGFLKVYLAGFKKDYQNVESHYG
jgi:glycosyltransferase involved in cell wall biosynthesis